MAIFRKQYIATGAFAEVAAFMTTVAHMLDNIKVYGGTVRTTPTGISFYVTDSSFPGFPGICYAPNGVETSGLTDGTKPWLEFNEQDWTFSEIVGPVATPWAAYRQYRRKSDLRGPWYATVSG